MGSDEFAAVLCVVMVRTVNINKYGVDRKTFDCLTSQPEVVLSTCDETDGNASGNCLEVDPKRDPRKDDHEHAWDINLKHKRKCIST